MAINSRSWTNMRLAFWTFELSNYWYDFCSCNFTITYFHFSGTEVWHSKNEKVPLSEHHREQVCVESHVPVSTYYYAKSQERTGKQYCCQWLFPSRAFAFMAYCFQYQAKQRREDDWIFPPFSPQSKVSGGGAATALANVTNCRRRWKNHRTFCLDIEPTGQYLYSKGTWFHFSGILAS